MKEEKKEEKLLKEILALYKSNKSELIPILLQVQSTFGYLPPKSIKVIARFLNMSESQIYAVASFYTQFRLTPLGKKRVSVCRGTACHIRGASHILREIERILGLKEGETSADLEYTLDTVACIGCCALAPCLKINDKVYGEMTIEKVREIFSVSEKQ